MALWQCRPVCWCVSLRLCSRLKCLNTYWMALTFCSFILLTSLFPSHHHEVAIDIFIFYWNILIIRWIAEESSTDIDIPCRINWKSFGDPLTFHIAPVADQSCTVKYLNIYCSRWIGRKFCADINRSQRMYPRLLVMSGYQRNVSTNIEWISMQFGPDIHVKTNCNNFCDPLTVHASQS